MDFALLFGLYLFVCCCGIGCYLLSSFTSFSPLTVLLCWLSKTGEHYLPAKVVRAISSTYSYLFFERNAVFPCVYVFLLCGSHAVIFIDLLPLLYTSAPQTNHVFCILLFLVMNLLCFVWCCWGDPGEITAVNIEKYRSVYTANSKEQSGTICHTCRIEKLPRSRHCPYTDRCIFKYDHFCILTGSAVGGLNYRAFIGLLLSTCGMCVHCVRLTIRALSYIVDAKQLWRARYIDDGGIPQPMNYSMLIQTLFMQYPRLVLLLAAVSVLGCGVVSFSLYHCYLILTNQTTNERYKLARIPKQNSTNQESRDNKSSQLMHSSSNHESGFNKLSNLKQISSSPDTGYNKLSQLKQNSSGNDPSHSRLEQESFVAAYNAGIVCNVLEFLFPLQTQQTWGSNVGMNTHKIALSSKTNTQTNLHKRLWRSKQKK